MLKYSLPLGKIAGIKISVHWTFAILILWIVFAGARSGLGAEGTLWTLLFILSIFGCVVLHELGHALAARRYHIKTRDITLLPIGGLARLESMPEKPKEELVIAIAGPAVNILIALAFFPIVYLSGKMADPVQINVINSDNFLYAFVSVNIVLAVFNMIPAFPMDGGRVLRALLSFRFERHIATRIAATIGQLLAIGFVFVGFYYNPFLIFIGFFIFLGAQAEAEYAQVKSTLKGFRVKDALMKKYTEINADEPLKTAITKLLDGQCKNFLVMENSRPVGTLSREEIIKALSAQGENVVIHNIMNKEVLFLNPETPLDQALQQMQSQKKELTPVMEHQQLIGALDLENIMEFIMVQNAMEKAQN